MSQPDVSIVTAAVAPVNGRVRSLVALTCAASAGVHAALVPEHYREGGLLLAGAFALSTLALAAAGLQIRRPSRWTGGFTALVLLAVAAAYLLSRTSGIPGLIPEPEHFEALGVLTTIAEVVAATVAACLPPNRKESR